MKYIKLIITCILTFLSLNVISQTNKFLITSVIEKSVKTIKVEEAKGWYNEVAFFDYVTSDEATNPYVYDFYKGQSYLIRAIDSRQDISSVLFEILKGKDIIISKYGDLKDNTIYFDCPDNGFYAIRLTYKLNGMNKSTLPYGLTIAHSFGANSNLIAEEEVKGSDMVRFLANRIEKIADTTLLPARIETGVLIDKNDELYALTDRVLSSKYKYDILVFTDYNSKDIKLEVTIEESKGKWKTLVSEDNNHPSTKSDDNGMGDLEEVIFSPTESDEYSIEIDASKEGNKPGRFAVIVGLFRKEPVPTIIYSSDQITKCRYDAKNIKVENCDNPTEDHSNFEINEEESTIKINNISYQILNKDEYGDNVGYKLISTTKDDVSIILNKKEQSIIKILHNEFQYASYHIKSYLKK